MNKIALILRKEWLELRQERLLVLTTFFLPLLFSVGPVLLAFGLNNSDGAGSVKGIPPLADVNPALKGMNALELAQAVSGQQTALLLLLLPTIITSVVASYSVVGEKTSRTLEPLLATPVTTLQLLLAKSLAAVIPALVVTWLGGAVFAGGMAAASISGRVFEAIVTPAWLLLLLLWTPLISMITVGVTVAVSARVNDPRSAQQVSALLILPIMGLFVGQISGVLVLGPSLALVGALVLAVLAALTVWLAVTVFNREAILTKWL